MRSGIFLFSDEAAQSNDLNGLKYWYLIMGISVGALILCMVLGVIIYKIRRMGEVPIFIYDISRCICFDNFKFINYNLSYMTMVLSS